MLPNFVCIGSQKAGTGWLYRNLKSHPEIWMPPIKELQYYIRPSNFYILYLVSRDRYERRSVIQDLKRGYHHLKKHPSDLGWFMRFFLYPRNDKWYASLFRPNPGQICGEITPDYETLSAEEVGRFHTLMPDTKILLFMRNPIKRIWSNTAMDFRKFGYSDLSVVKDEDIEAYLLGHKYVLKRSDYISTLDTWESYYPPEQIFTGFQDKMQDNPAELLYDIHRFLGVAATTDLPKELEKRKNVGSYPDIPPNFARMLAERFLEPVEKLHERFQNRYTESWLTYTRELR